MKIVKSFPPNIEAIRKRFKLHDGIIFTYGSTIYSPHSETLPEHLIVHEQTHEKQQGKEIEKWWALYLSDDMFRLSQEVEAYQNQYKFVAEKSSRQVKRAFLKEIAKTLSSPIYGNVVTFNQAKEWICPN